MPAGGGRGGGPWWKGLLGRGPRTISGRRKPDFCICPGCGFVAAKVPGSPCFLTPCPTCGTPMARRFSDGD